MLKAWAGQSFNTVAVRTLGRVAQHPSLDIPHVAVESIAQVDFAALKVGECVCVQRPCFWLTVLTLSDAPNVLRLMAAAGSWHQRHHL